MEVKVCVDGIPRVVCGVTEETTCHEVVIALAQALGQTGRYTLREKFKDFERCMAPNERLLETLEKYGEQAREVQLTLLHTGPLVSDEMSRTNIGRYQPCPPLRKKDVGGRMRRGSGSLGLHRRSLPPLSSLKQEPEQQKEDPKRTKRKSLSLMEEAWEWLGSLGKGRVYSTTASDKESDKEKRNRSSLDLSLIVNKDVPVESSRSKVRGKKGLKSDLDHQTSCCMGSQTAGKDGKHSEKTQKAAKSDNVSSPRCATTEDEKNRLRETLIRQLSCLQDLQDQIERIDQQIVELEESQRAQAAGRHAQQRKVEDESEQIKFWENELKAEEGYEKDLQLQFLDMRTKAVECKAKLDEYRREMQGLDFFAAQSVDREDSEVVSDTATEAPALSTEDHSRLRPDPDADVKMKRMFPPRGDFNPPHALVPPSQMKERRPTGPTELREWWTRWSEAQSSQSLAKKKVIHRSELTIYLGSTKI